MRVIPPLTVTEELLIDSNISEPDGSLTPPEEEYSTLTTYDLGDEVISSTTHRRYESLQAANLNNPLPDLPAVSTAWWLDIGPTNKWAMFDLYRNTKTSGTSPLIVEVSIVSRINSVALLGLEATSALVELLDAGSPTVVLYTHTEDLTNPTIVDWYAYAENTFQTKPAFVLFDLPPYLNAILRVTITNTGGDAACGALAIGSYQFIGTAQENSESDVINFSVVERDAFGNATLIPRRSIPRTNQNVMCDKALVDAVRALRVALNAVPAVYSWLDDSSDGYFDAGLILGFYRKFSINAAQQDQAVISLELEEV